MKLALVSSVFVNYSLDQFLCTAAKLGYAGVDLWGGRPHVFRNDISPEGLHSLRRHADDLGLVIVSLMPAFYRYPFSLCTPNDSIRQESLDYMRISLDNAAELGVGTVLVVPGRSMYGQDPADTRGRMTDSLARICEMARPRGIRVGVEAVNRYVSDIVTTGKEALDLVREVGADNVGVVLDTGHIHIAGQTGVEDVHILGDLLYQIHINDNDGKKHQGLIPGDGNFDYQPLFKAISTTGYDGFLSVELAWDYSLDPEPAAALAAARLKNGTAQL
jgi:protein FrlC